MKPAKPAALPSTEAIKGIDFKRNGAATGPDAFACDGYAGGVRRVACASSLSNLTDRSEGKPI